MKKSLFSRAKRHTRLSWKSAKYRPKQTPPFIILFINSICNLSCEHCFYWKNLNQRDDLTLEEIEKLSLELGQFEILNLSGGEPFLRPEFAEVCSFFIRNNGVKQIYVPTNGYFTERTERQVAETLKNKSLELFVCELSLDGMPEYHNKFRGNDKSFEKAMETYAMLVEMQKSDQRLRIHSNSVATSDNMAEILQLTEYLHTNCPSMDHHNLAVIRGDRKNPSLKGPALQEYRELYTHVKSIWEDREKGRFGAIVEPLLQWAKVKTIETESQYIPCKAGILSAVIYANGDVSFCETHEPLGNLREHSFFDIWESEQAEQLRQHIRDRKCFCTNEVFLWPSIVFQPTQLARAIAGSSLNL